MSNAPTASDDADFLVIDGKQSLWFYIRECFRFSQLLFFFAWRDILVRYKQAFFGVAWAIIRPLMTVIPFVFLFKGVAHLSAEGVSYPLFVLAAMLAWQCVAGSMQETALCLINNAQLISKVYFPRSTMPSGIVLVQFFDFTITFIFVLTASLIGGYLSSTLIFFPLYLLLLAILCLGLGLWLSAVTALYRDLRLVIPVAVQFGMFISPVGYSSSVIPASWLPLYCLNPVVGIIDGFRYSILGYAEPSLALSTTLSVAMSLLIFISGFLYFKKMETNFADRI